jgi:hypothetical protein
MPSSPVADCHKSVTRRYRPQQDHPRNRQASPEHDPSTITWLRAMQPGILLGARRDLGNCQVVGQRIQVGFSHAGQTVTIQLGDTTVRIIDQNGEPITTGPRNGTGEISRFKAYGTKQLTP